MEKSPYFLKQKVSSDSVRWFYSFADLVWVWLRRQVVRSASQFYRLRYVVVVKDMLEICPQQEEVSCFYTMRKQGIHV